MLYILCCHPGCVDKCGHGVGMSESLVVSDPAYVHLTALPQAIIQMRLYIRGQMIQIIECHSSVHQHSFVCSVHLEDCCFTHYSVQSGALTFLKKFIDLAPMETFKDL